MREGAKPDRMNRPSPLLAIRPPVPARLGSGVVGGMLITGIFFRIVETAVHNERYEIATLICLAVGLVRGVFLFGYIAG